MCFPCRLSASAQMQPVLRRRCWQTRTVKRWLMLPVANPAWEEQVKRRRRRWRVGQLATVWQLIRGHVRHHAVQRGNGAIVECSRCWRSKSYPAPAACRAADTEAATFRDVACDLDFQLFTLPQLTPYADDQQEAVWQLQPKVVQILVHNNLPTRHYMQS